MKVLIVQPWFTAIGHPAQSVLNVARMLGTGPDVGYLIADPGVGMFAATATELKRFAPVTRFNSRGASLRTGTLMSLPAVARTVRAQSALKQVFFLDAHLVALAAGWPLFSRSARGVAVSAVYLGGPERIASHALARALVSRFLSSPGRRLFLRTEELRRAWCEAFMEIPADQIATLPSLELIDAFNGPPLEREDHTIRFGVIGQVRPGKSLEWLVPLFSMHPEIGLLQVAGTFTNPAHQARLAFLSSYAHFQNRFLTEDELLGAAARQDYLLALYDDWDARMEAATLHLAARVGKPVIVYDEGWPGRMVREFGCGLAVSRDGRPDEHYFMNLPRPGQQRYQAMIDGVERFRAAHNGVASRDVLVRKLFDE